MTHHVSRRAVLGSTALLLPGAAAARYVSAADGFAYEVTRTEAEWLGLLGEDGFRILRQGFTETPKSDPHWDSTAPGLYACRGCELPIYDARWKVVLDIGWLFFSHSEANAVLTGVDWPDGAEMTTAVQSLAAIEVHCRRCGSHLGHIVHAQNKLLHCVNGASLSFTAA